MIINRKPAGKAKNSVRGIGIVTLQNRFLGIFTIAILAAVAAMVTVLVTGQYASPVGAQSTEGHVGTNSDAERSFCDIDLDAASGGRPAITLPDCTDGEVHLTNFGSTLTTDNEVENNQDREDERSWLLETSRDYVGSGNTLYASVITLQEKTPDPSPNDDLIADYETSNYILEDYDRVIVTVIDSDRNSTSEANADLAWTRGNALATGEFADTYFLWTSVSGDGTAMATTNSSAPSGFRALTAAEVGDRDNGGTLTRDDFSFAGSNDATPYALTIMGTGGGYWGITDRSIRLIGDQVALVVECDPSGVTNGCMNNSGDLTLQWDQARFNFVDVVVNSDRGDEFALTLVETGTDTGIFEGVLKIIQDLGDVTGFPDEGYIVSAAVRTVVPPAGYWESYVYADDGDNIRVTYEDQTGGDNDRVDPNPSFSDRIANLRVDASAPDVTITTPAENDIAESVNPLFEGSAQDGQSGLLENRFYFASRGEGNTDPIVNDAMGNQVISNNLNSVRAYTGSTPPAGRSSIDSGNSDQLLDVDDDIIETDDFEDGDSTIDFRVTERDYASNVDYEDTDQYVRYQAYAVDLAGNIGISDSEPDEDLPQPGFILIDSTAFSQDDWNDEDPPITGRGWDPGDVQVEANVRDSILVIFPERLDPASLDNSDFDVESDESGVNYNVRRVVAVSPEEVDEEDLNGDGTVTSADENLEGVFSRYIFLELDRDILSGDTPDVSVVGEFNDRAGNRITRSDDLLREAEDGLAPNITSVELSGGSGSGTGSNGPSELTDDEITIDIVVDEVDISASDVRIRFYEKDPNATSAQDDDGTAYTERFNRRARKTGDGTFELTTGVTGIDGDVFVVVEVQDNEDNLTVFGADERTDARGNVIGVDLSDLDDNADNVVFTLDTEDPEFASGTGGDVETSDSRRSVVFELSEDIAEVNLAELEMANGTVVDISSLLDTSDDRTWVYKPASDLPLGRHTARVEVTDFAGNESDTLSYVIEVDERSDFTLNLRAGWNAVSFPSNPSNNSVSAVFTNSGISQVLAYEPWSRVPWKVARRSGSGFSGDLTEIRAGVGYWVLTDTFEDQTVLLDSASEAANSGIGSTPSTIRTESGWNFIGVLDPTFDSVEGDSGDVLQNPSSNANYLLRDYLASNDISRVYEYDTINEEFDTRVLDGTTVVAVGSAYWVFVSSDPSNPIAP